VSRASGVRVRDLAMIDRQLAARERKVVKLLASLTLMSGSQLRRTCFNDEKHGRSDPQIARRVLLKLTKRGVLIRLERRIGGVKSGSEGFTYRLGPVGQRLAGLWAGEGALRGRRSVEPGERFVAHRLAVSELYVRLHEAAAKGALTVVRFEGEPACWRTFTMPLHGAMTLKPDAFVQIAVGEWDLWWFVEVDRGTVSQATRARQAAAYRAYWRSGAAKVMPRVLWVAKDTAVAERAVMAVRPDSEPLGLFVIATEEGLLDVIVKHEVSS
jgi:Replication-relaxation